MTDSGAAKRRDIYEGRDSSEIAAFKRNSTELLRKLETSGRSQVLTVDGRPKAVLISVEVFEHLAEQVERAETLEGIKRGIADMEAGRTMSLAEAEAELKKRFARRRKKGSKSA